MYVLYNRYKICNILSISDITMYNYIFFLKMGKPLFGYYAMALKARGSKYSLILLAEI